MWEKIMGILSDLFGAGRRRDEAQDRHIEELMSRVLTLEQSPGGGVGQPALDALAETVDAQRAVIEELTGQIATLTERQAIDDVARAARSHAGICTPARAGLSRRGRLTAMYGVLRGGD